jgi:hypothetical protein
MSVKEDSLQAIHDYFDRVVEPENKRGVVSSSKTVKDVVNVFYRTGATSIFPGDEDIFNHAYGFHSIPELHKFVYLKTTQFREREFFRTF